MDKFHKIVFVSLLPTPQDLFLWILYRLGGGKARLEKLSYSADKSARHNSFFGIFDNLLYSLIVNSKSLMSVKYPSINSFVLTDEILNLSLQKSLGFVLLFTLQYSEYIPLNNN